MANTQTRTQPESQSGQMGKQNTGQQSSAQTQSGSGQVGSIDDSGVRQSNAQKSEYQAGSHYVSQSNRPTGEPPSTNRGFSQAHGRAQNEMSQRAADNSPEEIQNQADMSSKMTHEDWNEDMSERMDNTSEDVPSEQPHRKDPSSINQVSDSTRH